MEVWYMKYLVGVIIYLVASLILFGINTPPYIIGCISTVGYFTVLDIYEWKERNKVSYEKRGG